MIAPYIKETMNSKGASVIRKMFEEGIQLKKQFGQDKVFDFSLGNPDLDPPEKVVEAVRKIADDVSHGRHGYMQNAGYSETRSAMAQKVSGEQQVTLCAENIVMTCGAASAINCVLKAVVSPGDEVIVPAPFFAEYRHYVNNFSGHLVEVPSNDDFSLNIEKIKSSLSEKTAAIIINTPNNPTGKIFGKSEIEALCKILSEHGKTTGRFPYLICDEPYRAIVYDNAEIPPVFGLYSESVVVSSFAKDLSLPGERIGYIAANPKMQDCSEFISACTFALRTLGFVNAPAFFQKVVAQSWDASVDYSSYKKRRDILMNILDEAGLEYCYPQGAFYLFVKVPEKWNGDDAAFCDHLKKFLILSAPGGSFGKKGYFRLAYCVAETTIENSRDAFINAVK